jgi:GYF domain 2
MYRIIGGDGREYGPVTGDTIRQWIVQNRANAKTLVRADDSADWRPLGEIPEFAGSFGAPPPQQLAEAPPPPAPPPAPHAPAAPADPAALTAAYAGRESGLSIGDCIGGAFRVLGINYWQAVGVTFLVMACIVVIQFIPLLNILASLLLTQVFNAGLYFYFVKLSRGDATVVGDGFSGFAIAFGQLVLLSLVVNLLIAVVLLPMVLPVVGMALWQWNPWVMVPLAIVLALPVIYLSVAWTFAPILVVDRGLEFWDAMELSRKVVSKCWFRVFFVILLAGLIASLGIIGLGVGIIFTLPVMGATVAVAYGTLFPSE